MFRHDLVGPLRIAPALLAAWLGAGSVALFDVAPAKLELARKMGFHRVHDGLEADPIAVLRDLTGGEGAPIQTKIRVTTA